MTSNQRAADVPRDVLLGQTLRQRAHQLRIEACSAWSDVVQKPTLGLDEAKCKYARAVEGRLRSIIDELADLSSYHETRCDQPRDEASPAPPISKFRSLLEEKQGPATWCDSPLPGRPYPEYACGECWTCRVRAALSESPEKTPVPPAEYESVGWQFRYPSIWGPGHVWLDHSGGHNGNNYDLTREIFARRAENGEARCPHGFVLAENVCGPCSEGRPNRPASTRGG